MDATFVIGRDCTHFKVNRVGLAAISSVFEAMLYGQMKEGQRDSKVIIDDIDADGFRCILNYAYCGNPNITYENVLDVLYLCNKYQIDFLAQQCIQFLAKCINANNVCFLLNKAVKLKSNSIIKQCINFTNNLWDFLLKMEEKSMSSNKI